VLNAFLRCVKADAIVPHSCRATALRISSASSASVCCPAIVRAFCAALRIPEKPALKTISDCIRKAYASWPGMIAAAGITRQQKEKLLAHFHSQQLVQSVARRARVARKP
jgi:hypothetical protein